MKKEKGEQGVILSLPSKTAKVEERSAKAKTLYRTAMLCLYMLLMLCYAKTNAQQAHTIPLFYEKVYLHTDRELYSSGEDIWFKAYVVNAQTNKPINNSYNLYVELISPALKIPLFDVVRLDNGLGNGDFKLPDTLKTGVYRIRAYTNWMRNFGNSFVFEKTITIVNKEAQPTVAAKQKKLKGDKLAAETTASLPAGPLVRFFPEGGSMVNNVKSLVAVKAEDEWGRGIAATGEVIATSGRVVAKFTCDSLGMATFNLEPDETQLYHAEVIISKQKSNFKLPVAINKGFVISVNTAPDVIVAGIGCNSAVLFETGAADMILMAQHNGKTYYKQHFTVNSKNALVRIPSANFPEGIACITLIDDHGKPICERLVYVHQPNSTQVSLSADKITYQPKEKVTVKIKLSDTTKTHLSLAVVDAGAVPVQVGDIASYLNLTSEVKGTIEHPERYFDAANANRFNQLDMLLLTQGWRGFIWKKLAEAPPKITYDVEQSIPITGRVRKVWKDKPLNGINITMFATKADGPKLFAAVTDSAGRFSINGAVFYGYQYLNFTSRASNGITLDDGTSDGKTGGWVQVDSLYENRLPIAAMPQTPEKEAADTLIKKETARKKFTFTGINPLQTVQIKDLKGYNPELPPIEVAVTKVEQKDYESLLNYLLYNIPGSFLSDGKFTKDKKWKVEVLPTLKWGAIIASDPFCPPYTIGISGVYADKTFINYKRVRHQDYLFMPMWQILKVTIHRRKYDCGIYYRVSVVMRPGALDVKDTFDNAMADVVGYYRARAFYTPRYDTPNDNPDYRTTIHWEPNITTDANGEATVTYYNADPKTKIRLVVQGVTDNGVAVAAVAGYEVK